MAVNAEVVPADETAFRITIRAAVLQNRDVIALQAAALSVLIDEKLKALREQRPNSPEGQAAIAYYEDLKRKVEELREASSKPMATAAEEEAVVRSTTSRLVGEPTQRCL